MTCPYVEAGARAILRRALAEIEWETSPHLATDALVSLARTHDAPVDKIVGWWEIMAEGKPRLTERQREIMRGAAARAAAIMTGGPR